MLITRFMATALLAAARDTLTDGEVRLRDLLGAGKTTVAASALMAMAALGSPASASGQSAEPWTTKEFEVISSEVLGAFTAPVFNAVSEQVDEWLAAWGMEPTGARIYVPHPETRREIEDYMTEAAGLLEGWGFPPPDLPKPFGTFKIVLGAETLGGETVAGAYHPPVCGFFGGYLFLSANAILGEREEESGRRPLTPDGRATLAHELFHAVQANTRFYGAGCPPTSGSWIIEGTADAIANDILRRLRGEQSSYWVKAWGARNYSKRLPVPRVISLFPQDVSEDRLAAYFTSSFWRYLAEFRALRSAPGPEVNPFDYSYLVEMLSRQPASSDCSGSGAECDSELRWLTIGLKKNFGLTLRELYPLFAEALALYGNHRLPDVLGNIRMWRSRTFGDCPYFELTPRPNGRVHRDVIPTFEPVSTHCWEIVVPEFGQTTLVEISVKAPPGGRAIADLSAAVAGRPIRADTAVVDTTATGELTARWVVELPHDRESIFVLTNVAHDPANTTRMRNLPITFTALEEYVKMSLSGGESEGSGAGDGDGPTPAEIAQPTPIDFDVAEGDFSVFYDEGVCPVWLKLRSRQEDALWIMGRLSPPITPGSYPIVNATSGGLDVVGGELHSPRYNAGGYSLRGQSGFLEIESASHLIVVGRVRTHLGLGDVGAEVHAEFALRPGSMVGGILGPQASDHPCFTRDDAPSQAAGTSGNQGPGEDGPGEDGPGEDGPGEDGPGEDTESGDGDTPGSDTPADSGGPPTDGDAVADPGGAPDDDPDSAGDREGPGEAGGDRPPREDSGAVGGAAGSTRMIEFLENGGGAVRSHPQPVHGSLDPGGFNVSSDAFDLQLALPVETAAQCTGPDSQLGGLLRLIAMGITEEAPFDQDGSHLISISNAALELDTTDRRLRLTLDFEKCGPTECTSAHLVVRAAPGSVNLIPAGGDFIRVDVADAAIEGTVAEYHGACDGLLDFTFNLQTVP